MGQAHSTMNKVSGGIDLFTLEHTQLFKTDLAVTTKGSVADGGTQGKLTMLTVSAYLICVGGVTVVT